MTDDRLKVGVAGLGAVAQSVHLPLLARRWDLFDLTAVCDLSPSLRDAVSEQYGVASGQRYGDVEQMVAESDVDAIVLLTSGTHGNVAAGALRQGVPVLCEKPLAYTVGEAAEIAAAERALGRRALLLGYMKEHDAAVLRMRELLADVDDVRSVDVTVLHPTGASQLAFANLRPVPKDADPAKLEWQRLEQADLLDRALGHETSAGLRDLYANVVLGSMVHDTSLLRILFGGLATVDEARAWPADTDPPSVEFAGQLAGGARARTSWHYLPDYPAYRETLTVHHGQGSLQVTFGTPYLLNAPTRLDVVAAARDGEVRSSVSTTGEAFESELVNFYRMVADGTAPRAGVDEGRADIVTSQRVIRLLGERSGESVGGEAATA